MLYLEERENLELKTKKLADLVMIFNFFFKFFGCTCSEQKFLGRDGTCPIAMIRATTVTAWIPSLLSHQGTPGNDY